MTLRTLKHTYSGDLSSKGIMNLDLFYTPEMVEERDFYNAQERDSACLNIIKKSLERNKNIRENSLENIAILTANGGSIGDTWYYFNEDAGFPIQHWIDEVDGKYKLIILDVYNPNNKKIKSKESIILHPNGLTSSRGVLHEEEQISIFLPRVGYIDSHMFREGSKKLEK